MKINDVTKALIYITGLCIITWIATSHIVGTLYIIVGLTCAWGFMWAVLYAADELGITGPKKMTIRNTLICLAKFVIIVIFIAACVLSLGMLLLSLRGF
jgi:hypothetical protein